MMNKELLQIEADLQVLKFMLQRMYATMYIASGKSENQIKEGQAGILEHARTQQFRVDDPAISALISGEIEDSLASFLNGVESIAKQLRR